MPKGTRIAYYSDEDHQNIRVCHKPWAAIVDCYPVPSEDAAQQFMLELLTAAAAASLPSSRDLPRVRYSQVAAFFRDQPWRSGLGAIVCPALHAEDMEEQVRSVPPSRVLPGFGIYAAPTEGDLFLATGTPEETGAIFQRNGAEGFVAFAESVIGCVAVAG